MIPVKQIAMVHDAGIDASAPELPGKDILAGNDGWAKGTIVIVLVSWWAKGTIVIDLVI